MSVPVSAGPVRIRPALPRGRRVDFREAAHWQAVCLGWRPSGGYWRKADGRTQAALNDRQPLAASLFCRLSGRRQALRPAEAAQAERGEQLSWTLALIPVPQAQADSELGCVRDR